jgi:DNA repair exonuclease SbcCD ATPase subunit
MADERIEVEWIATASQMVGILEKIDNRFQRQEQQLKKLGTASQQSAQLAENSFNKLEATLRENENALRNLAVGSKEFDVQMTKVNRLREAFAKMKQTIQGTGKEQASFVPKNEKGSLADIESQLKRVGDQLRKTAAGSKDFERLEQVYARLKIKQTELQAGLQKLGQVAAVVVPETVGSFNALERELKENEAALKKLQIGTSAFQQQKAKVDELRKSLTSAKAAMAEVGQQTVETGSKTGGVLSAGIGKVAQLVAGMVTFQTVVTAIVAELEKGQRLRMEAAGSTRTFEQSVADMALNIGAANVPQARQMILQNAESLGVTPAGLAQLFSSAISGGAADLDEALKLSAATLKMTAGDVGKAQPIMSGMLSLAGATGNRDFTAALGQLSQFQAAARGEDLATSINNMSTALAAANTRGERIAALGAERTLELSSTVSQLLQDPRMAVTGTAVRQLMGRMDAFQAKTQVKLDDGSISKITKEQADAFNALNTLDDRLAAMRAQPELGRQFLSTIEQSEGKVAIRQLVLGGKAVEELEAKSRGLITGLAGGQVEFENLSNVIGENTKLTQAANQAQAQLEVSRIRDPVRALEGQMLERFNQAMANANLSGFDAIRSAEASTVIAAAQEAQQAVGPVLIDTLQKFQQQTTLPGTGIPLGGAVAPQDRAQLQAAIDAIRQLAQEQANLQRQPVKVQAPPARPKEAPLPAEFAP